MVEGFSGIVTVGAGGVVMMTRDMCPELANA